MRIDEPRRDKRNTATGTGRAMILTTVVLVFTAVLMMVTLEYPYTPANATNFTNVNRIDAMHNTHCDGDVCLTLTCIDNQCRSMSSSQVANQPGTTSAASTTPVTLSFKGCEGSMSQFRCSNVVSCNNIDCTSVSCVGHMTNAVCTTDNGVQLTSCTLNFPNLSCRTETGTVNSSGVAGGDAG